MGGVFGMAIRMGTPSGPAPPAPICENGSTRAITVSVLTQHSQPNSASSPSPAPAHPHPTGAREGARQALGPATRHLPGVCWTSAYCRWGADAWGTKRSFTITGDVRMNAIPDGAACRDNGSLSNGNLPTRARTHALQVRSRAARVGDGQSSTDRRRTKAGTRLLNRVVRTPRADKHSMPAVREGQQPQRTDAPHYAI